MCVLQKLFFTILCTLKNFLPSFFFHKQAFHEVDWAKSPVIGDNVADLKPLWPTEHLLY